MNFVWLIFWDPGRAFIVDDHQSSYADPFEGQTPLQSLLISFEMEVCCVHARKIRAHPTVCLLIVVEPEVTLTRLDWFIDRTICLKNTWTSGNDAEKTRGYGNDCQNQWPEPRPDSSRHVPHYEWTDQVKLELDGDRPEPGRRANHIVQEKHIKQ